MKYLLNPTDKATLSLFIFRFKLKITQLMSPVIYEQNVETYFYKNIEQNGRISYGNFLLFKFHLIFCVKHIFTGVMSYWTYTRKLTCGKNIFLS